MEPGNETIFFGFFDVQTWLMADLNCITPLAHPRKKIPNMGTWTWKRIDFLFYFIFRLCYYVLVDVSGERDYLFWVLWRPNMRNDCPPMSHATGTPTQKIPNMGTWTWKRVDFLFFWIFRLCFYVLVVGTGERDYCFWILWLQNMRNGRPPLSHATGTPTQKNPKQGYLNMEKGRFPFFFWIFRLCF